jgi:hypothetical protein
MEKQIFNRIKRTLSILFIVIFITSVTATVSADNCCDGKGSFNKGSFNGNCNGNVNLGFFNGKINGNVNVGNQTCGYGNKTSPPPSIKNKFTDIAYATKSETQKLDIYLPNGGKGPFPVIIVFHGGGFSEGDKSRDYTDYMLQGLNHGYAVVTVDYRLSGEAKFPAAINDAKAAIRFIKVNAAQYHLNPNKIALWGVSAGGNLATLAGTTGGTNNCYDTSLGNANFLGNVTAVVDWFGPTNFDVMDKQFAESGIREQVDGVPFCNTEDSFPSQYLGRNISKVQICVNRQILRLI